jgi:hypothetical protein
MPVPAPHRKGHVTTRNRRRTSLVPIMLIALFAALAAIAVAGGRDAAAHGAMGHAAPSVVTAKELTLRQEMRRLWEDHVTWTRLAVISLTTDAPDTQATVGRLLRNQTDIGNAIKPFYGAAAGRQLTTLLREHILIAADLIAAAKKGDQAGVTSRQARWTGNADEIAAFLSSANAKSWKPAETKTMMRAHLRLTTDEVLARLEGDWAADVKAYDRIHRQILGMADMLSSGLVAQFPARFR